MVDAGDELDVASDNERPPSYEEAVRRAKYNLRRISATSGDVDTLSNAPSTSGVPTGERQPLLSRLPADQISFASSRHPPSSRIHAYFLPLLRLSYWKALFHLLVLNFPFALVAWIALFVGVLVGTSLLITLPLGVIVWWLTLIFSRSFTNAELSMQARFHGVYTPDETRRRPIFRRPGTEIDPETLLPVPQTFLQNSYDMFQDWEGSYLPIFYFLVIKSAITLVLFPLIIIITAPAMVLVIPLPLALRLVRTIGRWQAKIAVQGLA